MKTAMVVKENRWLISRVKIYRLSEPVPWRNWRGVEGVTSYVVVSAALSTFDTDGPEAMGWACDADGEFLADPDRGESVCVAASIDHDDAIKALGFEVVTEEAPS